jgi:hypothetical protein
MLRCTISLIAIATLASPAVLRPAATQVTHQVALSGGRAFMLDLDDPDPSGSHSFTGAFERRNTGGAFSFGIEAGLHEYLILSQDLPPDVTGWSSKLEDTRTAWRVTPFVRWGTRGSDVRLYGQVGMGLYVEQHSYFDQQRERGELVVDTQFTSTDPGAGIHLGLGLELFPGKVPVGVAFGFRSHAVLSGGDWFNTGEVGLVYRWGKRSLPESGSR